MSDDTPLPDEQAPAATVENVVAVVVPDGSSDSPDELSALRAQVAALQSSLDAHYAAHAEIETDEDADDDRSDDDTGTEPERNGAETETPPQPGDRPVRRGLGGFLFGPIRRNRD